MKCKILFFSIAAFTWFIGTSAIAEEYNLSQLTDLAVSRSKQIDTAKLEAQSREMDASQASAWDNPNLDLATENKNEVGGSTRQWKAGISQTMGAPGRYSLRGDVANADYRIARIEQENAGLFLRHEVYLKTFQYLVAEEMAKHGEERLSRFKDVQSYISSRTFASPQRRTEASIVTGKILVLEKELLKLKAESEAAWENVNLYVGLPSKPKIRTNWYRQGETFSFDEMKERLDSKNPEIIRQKLVVEKSDTQLKLSRKEIWPTFTLSGFYGDGSGFAPEKTIGLGLSFPIPIFNANSAGVSASRYRTQAEVSRLSFERDKALLRLKTALLKYDTAKSAIQRLPVSRISEIEKGMSMADQGFRKGQVDLLTYIEADSQHSDSLEAIYAAQAEYVSYLSTLLAMVGDSTIPEETKPR